MPNKNDGISHCSVYEWRIKANLVCRLALLCFMWDTQHAVLFSQSLCMNAAELKVSLPWDLALWEADTAEEWHGLNSKTQPQPQYLSVLKTYIKPTSTSQTPSLNALSRVLMLHGLMSVAWDLNRRDQTSLGTTLPSTPQLIFKELMNLRPQPKFPSLLADPHLARLRYMEIRLRAV
jgi:Fungal specific transcription factor domain